MKRILLLTAFQTIIMLQAAHAGARFAEFKFQPDTVYNIEVFHKNVITFQFNEPENAGSVPPERIIPLENQVLFKITLRTYPISEKNVMPVKLYLNQFVTLIKRGKEMVPQDSPAQNELQDIEFLGELDAAGTISLVSGRSESSAVPGGDASVFQLLDMIPDLPAGEHAEGAVFYMNDAGKFILPEREVGRIAFTYTVMERAGDEVRVLIEDSTPQRTGSGGEPEKLRLGTQGELRYSQSRQICTSVHLKTISLSKPEKEDLRGKGFVVNDRSFDIKVEEVKQ